MMILARFTRLSMFIMKNLAIERGVSRLCSTPPSSVSCPPLGPKTGVRFVDAGLNLGPFGLQVPTGAVGFPLPAARLVGVAPLLSGSRRVETRLLQAALHATRPLEAAILLLGSRRAFLSDCYRRHRDNKTRYHEAGDDGASHRRLPCCGFAPLPAWHCGFNDQVRGTCTSG